MTQSSKVDERVKNASLITKALRRPEFGAFLGAIAIFILFATTDTTGNFALLGGISGWTDIAAPIGIVGISVALLMIAGEFDLSTGVLVGTTGLLIGMLVTEFNMNIWAAIAIAFVFAGVIGFINGYVVVKTKLPSFIVTLATFFVLKGTNFAFTKIVTGSVRVTGTDKAEGFDLAEAIFASKFGEANFQIALIWWIGITILATFVLTRWLVQSSQSQSLQPE